MPKPKSKPLHPVSESESEETISSSGDEHDEEEEEEEFDLVARMNEMDIPIRRKTYALKGLQRKYRELRAKMLQEMADAEIQLMADTEELRVERKKIILGQREVTEEEMKQYQDEKKESGVEVIESDDEETTGKKNKGVKVVSKADETANKDLEEAANKPDGGIPRFWLTAMQNSDVLESRITDKDSEALSFLTDVTKEFLDGNPRKGFKLNFHFAKNKFFSNKVLEKTYIFDSDEKALDAEDPMLETIEGCKIDWTSSEMNLTVSLKKKKQRHKDKKTIRVVEREEPCESFFNFFKAPKKPEEDGDEDADEDDEMDYDQQMEMDYEAAIAFSDLLIPRAVHYYCGKAIEEVATGILGGLQNDDDDDEEEEEEEEEVAPKRGRGKKGPDGKRGGGEKEECKQQ